MEQLSAALVGLAALFVAGWVVNALDIADGGWLSFVAWLALAVGFPRLITSV